MYKSVDITSFCIDGGNIPWTLEREGNSCSLHSESVQYK